MTKKQNFTFGDLLPKNKFKSNSTSSSDLIFDLRKLQRENENQRDRIESLLDLEKDKDSEIWALSCQLSEIRKLFSDQATNNPLYASVLKNESPSPKLTSLGKIKKVAQTCPSLPTIPSFVAISPSVSNPPFSVPDPASHRCFLDEFFP